MRIILKATNSSDEDTRATLAELGLSLGSVVSVNTLDDLYNLLCDLGQSEYVIAMPEKSEDGLTLEIYNEYRE